MSLFATLGCGTDERVAFLLPALPDDPAERGPYALGITTLEIDDGQGKGRLLPIEVWYPARPPAGAAPDLYHLTIGKLELAKLASPGGAARDAPVDHRGDPHPVIVFSHGNGGVRFQSYYLTEHLATHGFVVVAPDHVGNTMHAMVDPSVALPAIEVARLRPIDASRALDAALAANAHPGHVLYAAIDASRAGVAGHSFGGFTAFRSAGATVDARALSELCGSNAGGLLCEGWTEGFEFPASGRDERFRVAMPQAPGGASVVADGFADIGIPTLIEAGDADQTTPYEVESVAPFEAIPKEAALVVIAKAGHFTFSNMCDLVALIGGGGALFGNVFDDGCGPDNIPPADAHQIANAYATAFFQTRLAGRRDYADALLAGHELPGVASYRTR